MHSVSRHLFDSYPLPLFRRLTVGGCYREKFFIFFRFRYRTRLILTFRLQAHSFDFQYFHIYSFWLCVIIFFDSFNFRSIFLVCSSLYFPRINFDLFQHCLFYALSLKLFISLTLLLVINKHLCLCEFVLCLFWLF